MRMLPSRLPRLALHVAALLALISVRGAAQVAADSTRLKAADPTAAGYGDSTRQGVDTSGQKPAADSLKGAAPAGNAAGTPPTPTDTVLSAACASARAGTLAPGLLLVLFRDAATEEERAAAVTSSGGASAGPAPGGGDYVRPAADTISSRDLADRLVQDAAVASISERTCPAAR
jgi:hypothetical protein